MILWPLFFILSSFADDDFAAEKYCFKSPGQAQKVSRELKSIQVPSDKVEIQNDCLVVQMRPHRRELIQSYIRNVDPSANISFSSAEIKREPCKLKVEKEGNLKSKNTNAQASPGGFGATTTESQSSSKETFQIQTLNDFELTVNQDVVKGSCRHITPDRYEITLTVRKDPKPLLPPAPQGTVVIVTNPPQPVDQETSTLETTLQLPRGTRVEIGSVIKDLREKNHGLESGPAARIKTTDGARTQKVFLGLE